MLRRQSDLTIIDKNLTVKRNKTVTEIRNSIFSGLAFAVLFGIFLAVRFGPYCPLIATLIITGCGADKRLTDEEKMRFHYDSLATELFLKPEVDLKVTSNIDSTRIDFFNERDFELLIEVRKLCQIISDSIGMRFKSEPYNIKDFGELEIDKQIVEFDTHLFPLIERHLNRMNSERFDSLTNEIGLSPATIVDFHSKVKKYFEVLGQDKSYSSSRRNLVITYYVSELSEVPYPKTMYRLFVNDRDEIVDFGKHKDYDKDIRTEDELVKQAMTINKMDKQWWIHVNS